ncbi:MAG: septation protein A [Thermoleophilia bacterium]|nr:septation protein A [Thermoleophilia bacterium]
MKLLFDLLPVALFFAVFKYADAHKAWAASFATAHLGFMVSGGTVGEKEAPVLLATVVVIAATALQVLYLRLRKQEIPKMLWVSLGLIVVLGSLTIYLKSETFIKWKPTLLYWAFAAVIALAPWVAGKSVLKALLGGQFTLPDEVWRRLTWAWVAFFAAMGFLNLWVAYTLSTDAWVNFKLFGGFGLVMAFMVAQALYLSRHVAEEPGGE